MTDRQKQIIAGFNIRPHVIHSERWVEHEYSIPHKWRDRKVKRCAWDGCGEVIGNMSTYCREHSVVMMERNRELGHLKWVEQRSVKPFKKHRRMANGTPKICRYVNCGKEFIPTSPAQAHCSHVCTFKDKALREQKRYQEAKKTPIIHQNECETGECR